MGKSLAERQRNMRVRTKGIPQAKLTRSAALNALAAQIAQLADGPDKAALLARYLSVQGRRRVTKIKHVTDRTKSEPQADEDTTPPTEGEFYEPQTMLVTLPDGTQRDVDAGEFMRTQINLYKQWEEANALGALAIFVTPSDFVADLVPNVSARFLAAPSAETLLKHRQSSVHFGVVKL